MILLSIWNRFSNFPTPIVTDAWRILKAFGANYFYKLKETDAFDYTNSSIVRDNEFDNSVYKMFDNLQKNKENDDASSCSWHLWIDWQWKRAINF